ncbi:MAG: carbohydrate ABC transporter permease [Ruthenibacterium lactatiformans]|jgi:hypothetical protein
MKRKKRLLTFYLPLALLVAFIVLPYLWTLVTSLKTTNELYSTQVTLFPKSPSIENYKMLLKETDFLGSVCRSFAVGMITSLLAMVVATMAGYAISRYRFRGRTVILRGILLLYMFPSVLFLTPLYKVFNTLKLIGSNLALVIAYCTFTIPFGIWLLVSYIDEIPREIDEAGMIDGANVFQIIIRLLFPLLCPGLVATGSYIFINSWNEYLYAVMFTTSKNRTLPVMLSSLVGQYDIRWDLISAGAVLALLPTVILFMLVQKQLISGLASGSVKG